MYEQPGPWHTHSDPSPRRAKRRVTPWVGLTGVAILIGVAATAMAATNAARDPKQMPTATVTVTTETTVTATPPAPSTSVPVPKPPKPQVSKKPQAANSPAITALSCKRKGKTYSITMKFRTSGKAGTARIVVGKSAKKVGFTAKDTQVAVALPAPAKPTNCTATVSTSSGTVTKTAKPT